MGEVWEEITPQMGEDTGYAEFIAEQSVQLGGTSHKGTSCTTHDKGHRAYIGSRETPESIADSYLIARAMQRA